LKDSFEVLYTGLKRVIGSPEDYSKNRKNGQFPVFDLSIPVSESDQNPNRYEEEKQNLEQRISSMGFGDSGQNLQRNRVMPAAMSSGMKKSSNLGPKIDLPEDQMYMPVSCLNTFT
jgi:hypothetical protein